MKRDIIHKINTAIRLFREATYHYSDDKYPDSFMSSYTCPRSSAIRTSGVIDRVIYVFWTGDNPMSCNRENGLKTIIENSGVEVKLITPHNLENFIKPEDPLPDAYQYLSHVHKSDYLRAYFMYHYGGGYADLKKHNNSWVAVFNRVERTGAYICGYPEICEDVVASPSDKETRQDLLLYWKMLIGTGAFVCRSHSPFSDEWYRETKKRVIEKSSELQLHPALDPRGKNEDYPIPWMYILGEVFHPLCLKYHRKVLSDPLLRPCFDNYL